ncbi:bifunctional UDP-N-acetylmuramoyl-tripeptide:D-alanyl-D-alanine ligase/alanine racemase [Bacteroides sp. OttesenSCG-928-D19]|nr:bifunctional UDP-N-acetylmuramoyl-tripeptide:D-alanyl-D-alanine ligase/alanine racemase [Bacteroides sp. OttesenSCG-928-D19]
MNYSIKEISGVIKAEEVIVYDSTIVHLLTDSRAVSFPETTLFFALKTQTNDGHKYVADLYALGVRNFVVSGERPEYEQMKEANFLFVRNTLKALQQLAAYHRKRFSIPVVGITGSNGKTVVKELLYQLMHMDFNIVRSPRSYNSQIGVPLSVWGMDEQHTLAVFEAGISQMDEMDELRPIISPTIGLITNIGEAHQENFQSAKEKCMEKLSLFIDSDVIIYHADDRLIESALEASCLSYKAIGWSSKDTDATLYIQSVEKGEATTKLRCTMMGITHEYVIPFVDDGFIEDIIHCMAIMFYLNPAGIVNKDAVFTSLESVAMRLEVKQGINSCQLINDTYNSDITSLSVALDFQLSRKAAKALKSTVILSDILQSGMPSKSLYGKVAELLHQKKVDRIIGIGKHISEYSLLFGKMEKEFYPSTESFIQSFKQSMFRNEMVLIKGSRAFHFERITELLEKKVHETILEVNLDAIIHNYNYYRSRLHPQTKMVCMVKAFGYGVGSFELAKTLQEHRCDYLAVAVADEGEDLRKEGISVPIMVMNPELSSFNLLFEHRLEPEIYSFRLLDALIKETARRGITSFPVHVKIDTGMHRLGFEPEDIPEICRKIKAQGGLVIRSVFSHLAGSDSPELDDFTMRQLDMFANAAAALENELGYPVLKHILNSAGIERFVDYQKDMVRLGISLYGVSASGVSKGLQCVCSLQTVILQIRDVPAGDSVGYGRKTFVKRDSRIAIIPIGYADGFDRLLSNGVGEVLVGGKRCPVVGNVCMDACMIDVTDTDACEGDRVIIFNDELTVSEIADKIGTIPYEILTSISPRVKRVYYRE